MVANNAFIIKEMEESAEERGQKKGEIIGQQKAKIELANNLLDILDDEIISIKTGLDIDIVKKLRKESETGDIYTGFCLESCR